MNRLLAIVFLLVCCLSASAVELVTATISITNTPTTNAQTLTVNGSTRTWTNSASGSPSTLIPVTNSPASSASVLLNHLTQYPFNAGHYESQTATTNVTIRGRVGEVMTVTVAGGWAEISYITNTVQSPTFLVRIPISVETPTNGTNIASGLVDAIGNYATNSVRTNSVGLSNYITKGASPTQTVASPMVLWSFRGTNTGLIGGTYTSPTLINPASTNLINYGNAIRSEGAGGNSFQIGSNAQALSIQTIAIGNNSIATGTLAMAIGIAAVATNQSSMAVGNGARATTNNATAIGQGAIASGNGAVAIGLPTASADSSVAIGTQDSLASGYAAIAIGATAVATAHSSIAIGNTAAATFSNSVAIGSQAATTTTNQVMAGTSSHTVVVPGLLAISGTQTNTTFRGTNVLNGRLDFTSRANAGLANGNNAAVVLGTNVYIRLSGATTIGVVCGFAAEQDGSWHIVEISGAITNTIANQSGVDPTAANRIVTGTGADISFTNSPTIIQVIYNAADSRWKLMGLNR